MLNLTLSCHPGLESESPLFYLYILKLKNYFISILFDYKQ